MTNSNKHMIGAGLATDNVRAVMFRVGHGGEVAAIGREMCARRPQRDACAETDAHR